jgi:hypothetical protein
MREMNATTWRRRGSSVVYHKCMLGPLIASGCLISLREALGWMRTWPKRPPGDGPTVLIAGLEACLEVLSAPDGEEFLRHRIKPFIQEFQSQWDQCGLVFGFGCSPKRFRVDPHDDVLFSVPGSGELRFSASLWNGAARQDMYHLLVTDPDSKQPASGGFYVRRLS